jgi:hypothetical protein
MCVTISLRGEGQGEGASAFGLNRSGLERLTKPFLVAPSPCRRGIPAPTGLS